MSLTITHNAIDGTLVHGTARQDGSAPILKTFGLRWSRRLGAWFLPHSRAAKARTDTIESFAAALRAGGFVVAIDTESVSVAEAEEARAQIAGAREEALRGKAARLREQATAQHADARRMLEVIPPGQPILVGHHSEGRHRRHLDCMDRTMSKAIANSEAARGAAHAADATAAGQAHRQSLSGIGRRLARLQATARDLERRIGGTASALSGPATGDYLDRLTAQAAETSEQITYWTEQREALIASGAVHAWTRADFQPDDRIVTVSGSTGTVKRVNAKSLSVHYDVFPASFTNRVSYHDVRDRLTRRDELPAPSATAAT